MTKKECLQIIYNHLNMSDCNEQGNEYNSKEWCKEFIKKHLDDDSGADLIAEERQRQVNVEGYSEQHDSQHKTSELIRAAIAYIESAKIGVNCLELGNNDAFDILVRKGQTGKAICPWGDGFKPSTDIRDLEKAGALIAAAIDRLRKEPMAAEMAERITKIQS